MVVSQLRAIEVPKIWREMERNTAWAGQLITNRLSAGVIVEFVAGGRGSTVTEGQGVTPFIFL